MKKSFVEDVRELRWDEIQRYEEKGYLVPNKASYVLNDTIAIKIGRKQYCFGMRVNINDVYFYILHEGSQIYLSIYQIYLLLWKLVNTRKKKYVTDALDFYMENDEEIDFVYRGKIYMVHKLPDYVPNDRVRVLDSDINISARELFLLIYLIQDKSNYLESLSKEGEYVNGLVRLLRVLLLCDGPVTTLQTLGWMYNAETGRFYLQKEKLVGKRNQKRYYLTEAEEEVIL